MLSAYKTLVYIVYAAENAPEKSLARLYKSK